MPGVSELAAAINETNTEARGDVILTAMNAQTDDLEEDFIFQYFPESISDTKQINHQQKEIPGASLPLIQWVGSGERLISFTAYFASDIDYLAQGDSKADEIRQRVKSEGLLRRNVDVRTALSLLRQFMLPTYGTAGGLGVPVTFAPRKVRLFIPGSGIGVSGGVYGDSLVTPDSIFAVMTQCDITYVAFFPTGFPRIATVDLAFSQIAQVRGTINFPQAIQNSADVEIMTGGRLLFYGTGGQQFLPYGLEARKKAGLR